MNCVELISGAWFGDRPMMIDFPPHWEIDVFGNDIVSSLSDDQIKAKIGDPIGTQQLYKLSAHKKRAVIVVDDLTRPTPVTSIIQAVTKELDKGGIKKDAISILIAGGTHAPASEAEITRKLGKEIAGTMTVILHDADKNVVFLGKSSLGVPVYVNKNVVDADLVIGIGCIYPHPAAGFSGGSKIIAPGVCGSETVRYLHDYIKGGIRGKYQPHIEFIQEIRDIATRVGLDFIVNVVLNQKREIAGLFAGDKVQAHEKGIHFAIKSFSIKPVAKNFDIIIMDVYPFDMSLQFAKDRGLWLLEGLGNHISKVVIADFSAGLGNHVLYPVNRQFSARLSRRIKNLQLKDFRFIPDKIRAIKKIITSKNQQIMFFSNGITNSELTSVFPKASVFQNWNDIIHELNIRHKNFSVKVALYQCSPYLIES
jgi:nickel-dependent lactate racemase